MNQELKNIDGLYLPETHFDMHAEAARLKDIMDRTGFVTLFVSEGACMDEIVAERLDAPGHVTEADDQRTAVFQAQLAVDVDMLQQNLSAIAQQLLIGQHGRRPTEMRS